MVLGMRPSMVKNRLVCTLVLANAGVEALALLMSPQGFSNFSLQRLTVLAAAAFFMYIVRLRVPSGKKLFIVVFSIIGSAILLVAAASLIPVEVGYAGVIFIQVYTVWLALLNLSMPAINWFNAP